MLSHFHISTIADPHLPVTSRSPFLAFDHHSYWFLESYEEEIEASIEAVSREVRHWRTGDVHRFRAKSLWRAWKLMRQSFWMFGYPRIHIKFGLKLCSLKRVSWLLIWPHEAVTWGFGFQRSPSYDAGPIALNSTELYNKLGAIKVSRAGDGHGENCPTFENWD